MISPISLGYVSPSLQFLRDGTVRAAPFLLDPSAPDEPTRQFDMRQMQKAGVRFVVLGVANPDSKRLPGSAGLEYVIRMLTALRDGFDQYAEHCRPVLYREDLSAAAFRRDPRVAFLLSVSGNPYNGSLQNLSVLHRLGVRSIHPFSSDPAVGGFSGWGETRRGLTRYGRELLLEAQRLGIMIDLAHTNDRTFREALRVVTGPVINSHSNARSLRDIDRNTTDDQMRALAAIGGVIGTHFSSSFLAEPTPEAQAQRAAALKRNREVIAKIEAKNLSPAAFFHRRFDGSLFDEAAGGNIRREPVIRAPMERLVDHLLHMLAVSGEDHVALGSDYVLGDLCGGVTRVENLPHLLEALAKRGISKATLRKLAWENWLRVYRSWLPSKLANSPGGANVGSPQALSQS